MNRKIHHRLLNFVGALVLLNIVFAPPINRRKYDLKVGEIATYDVIAPYTYAISKSPEELAAERAEIATRIPPIFESTPGIAKALDKRIGALETFIDSSLLRDRRDTILAMLQRDFGLPRELGVYLLRSDYKTILGRIDRGIQDLYARGIADTKPANFRIIAIQTGDKEIVETIDRLYTMADAESVLIYNATDRYRDLVRL